MCYTVEYIEQKSARLAERFKKILPPDGIQKIPAQLPLYYFVSGFEHPTLPVVKYDGLEMCQWGLIPSWVKDAAFAADIRTKTLNAVAETAFEKASFKKSIASQRCLLPVNGFYEWRDFNKKKYPYLIHLKSQEIFSLGCIYETWTDHQTGEVKNTFSILTTPANPLMEKIHNLKKRMPFIVPEGKEAAWIAPGLTPQEVNALIRPYDENDMTSYTVSTFANSTRNQRNTLEILTPITYPELS